MKFSKPIFISALILSIATIGVSGCATASFGNEIAKENVAKIVKGKTTKSEIYAMFGEPYNTSMMPDGTRLIMYIHTRQSINYGKNMVDGFKMMAGQEYHVGNSGQTSLQISLNKDGIVTDYEYSGGN